MKPKPVDTLDMAILNAIPLPAFVVDGDVRIVDMNIAAAQLCAQDIEVVYKCRAGEVLHCIHSADVPEGCGRAPLCQQCVIRKSVTNCLQGQAASRARMSMEFLPKSRRKKRELLITANPIPASDDHLALLIVEDITINDELEKALRRSEKLAVTGRLIATLAHEINNPLESLNHLLYLLKMEPELRHSGKELLELAEREVARLTTIARQTLAPHRATAFSVTTKLSELLDDVLAVFQPSLAKIVVRRNYQSDGEVAINPGEFRQVFTNLIANAIDAMGGGGELRLSIEKLPDDKIVVRIKDDGCGIPPENIDTIFEPFFTTKGEKGTGIGLFVIKGIVGKAGGTVEVESSTEAKTGTCFSIFLPMRLPG